VDVARGRTSVDEEVEGTDEEDEIFYPNEE
jgi:hypothetical protein